MRNIKIKELIIGWMHESLPLKMNRENLRTNERMN